MLKLLGLKPVSPEADIALANLAFRAIGEGGEPLRWEPFFFDWFGGAASEARALAGARGALYEGPAFAAFRSGLQGFEPDRPERLQAAYFTADEPEELLYPEIEALWAAIAERDDWAPFEAKIARIRTAGAAMAIGGEGGPGP
jgi:hypothetical protein